MSDFNFSVETQREGLLADALHYVTCDSVKEFHGPWGSLAVSRSHYYGFDPLETEEHICVVMGGPVLYFNDNNFIGAEDRQAGTRAILEHWKDGGDWSEDLSGPFVVLVIDKHKHRIECITDMMMFIPVYRYCKNNSLFLGTHIDALAEACGEIHDLDEVSLVDFVLHNVVTYPYTVYKNIRQCQPGSTHLWSVEGQQDRARQIEYYWQPLENNPYSNVHEAAKYLREGVQGYIQRVTGTLDNVAQFISAGEDSRALAGMLPSHLSRDGYIFLDSMNREGRVAEKVAKAYGASFKPDYRSRTHYLDIICEASDLVGSGHQYTHAHTLRFDKKHNLASYRAVFGGYISDSLLKAQYAKKPKGLRHVPFLPQFYMKGESRTDLVFNRFFSTQILNEITSRRRAHFTLVKSMRPESAHEWFELWPATMRIAIPNLYTNRRLFASYEVFMAKESVKVSARVPTAWKLNRRLFNQAFRPALKKTRFMFHADGRLPYYPWWVNVFLQAPIWTYQQIVRRTGIQKNNQGAWADWRSILATPRWTDDVSTFTRDDVPLELKAAIEQGALSHSVLSIPSKVNLLQACYQAGRISREK